MGNYYEYDCDLLIPYAKINVLFFLKNDYTLNPIQIFLLNSLYNGISIKQIEKVTNFTPYVIEQICLQLESQKLLIHENDTYSLSDISKNILFAEKLVRELNQESNYFFINLIDLSIKNKIEVIEKNNNSIALSPYYNKNIIDNLNIDDKMEYFVENMKTLDSINQEDINQALNYIYIQIKVSNEKTVYEKKHISRLPCLNSSNLVDKTKKILIAQGKMTEFNYSLKYKIQNNSINHDVSKTYTITDLFILLNKIKEIKSQESIVKKIYLDNVTGLINESVNNNSMRTYPHLVLPIKPISTEQENSLIENYIRQNMKAPDNYKVVITNKTKREYYTSFLLEDLNG